MRTLVQRPRERQPRRRLNELPIGVLSPRLRSGRRYLDLRVRPSVGSMVGARTALSKRVRFGKRTSHEGDRHLRVRNGDV